MNTGDDLSLKEVQILLGNLKAIYSKLSNEEDGAIVKLQKIIEEINPLAINFKAKQEKQELEEMFVQIEKLVKLQQSEIESVTVKYFEDSKELAETLIGSTVQEVLKLLDSKKTDIILEINNNKNNDALLKMNYILLGTFTLLGVVVGFTLAALII